MERWHMRLTIVNEEGGQTAVAMYPDSLYAILETLDECQIPYGNGGTDIWQSAPIVSPLMCCRWHLPL